MKIKEKYNSLMLVFTFIEDGYDNPNSPFNSDYNPDNNIPQCELISVNVGQQINNKFVFVESIKIPSNLLYIRYKSDKIKTFENFCNDRWNNKGLLLLDKHEKSNMIGLFADILLSTYRKYNDQITRIICGISPKKEYLDYCEKIRLMKKAKEEEFKKHNRIGIWTL